MRRFLHRFGIPFLIVAVVSGAGAWLSRQDKAKQVPTRETVAPSPVLMPPKPGSEQAYPGRNNPGPGQPPLPPGAVLRSLDKLNALAAAVGCPVLVENDPAVRVFDVAECLGEKAQQRLPGGQTGGRAK